MEQNKINKNFEETLLHQNKNSEAKEKKQSHLHLKTEGVKACVEL